MEPLVAVASYKDGAVEIWAPSQHPQAARDTVAGALGIPVDKVTVHVTLLGGGFGRKSKPDFIAEAALLSRAAGAPVRVQWTREDEIRHGYYHTVSAQHLEGAVDAKGRVTAWLHRTAFPTIGSTFVPLINRPLDTELGMGVLDLPFDIPNVRQETGAADAHTRIGWFRSVANIQHAFATNSFVGELAAATGRDPKDLLLALLGPDRRFPAPRWNYNAEGDPRHPVDTARLRHVVELAAEKAGWGQRRLGPGRGMGIAAHRSFLSYVATVVEVAIDADGGLRIPSVHTAIDCGFVANPDRVRAQMEGAAVMALSSALYGNITFKDGKVEQSNFHDYPVVRLDAAPQAIHTWIVPSEHAPGGVGEPGVPPFAPALCNAIHMAIGKRIRALPIAGQLAPKEPEGAG
jgi:isoquinoline 1-oxidoreductase beta subunit